MKNSSVIGGLIVGCIVAAATGYFDGSSIDQAPVRDIFPCSLGQSDCSKVATFVWKHTFPLSVDGVLVLPLIA